MACLIFRTEHRLSNVCSPKGHKLLIRRKVPVLCYCQSPQTFTPVTAIGTDVKVPPGPLKSSCEIDVFRFFPDFFEGFIF